MLTTVCSTIIHFFYFVFFNLGWGGMSLGMLLAPPAGRIAEHNKTTDVPAGQQEI